MNAPVKKELTEAQREKRRRKRKARAAKIAADKARAKASGLPYPVTREAVQARYNMTSLAALEERGRGLQAAGWPVSKWITFAIDCIALGLLVGVYEAKTTRSKYVYVFSPDKSQRFKVRFSNHAPTMTRQGSADSDFYVGVSNGLVTTTVDAMAEVRKRFFPQEVAP